MSKKPVYHPLDGHPIVTPEDTVAPGTILPKDEEVLNIVERKIAAGGKGAHLHQLDAAGQPDEASNAANRPWVEHHHYAGQGQTGKAGSNG